MIFEVGVVGLGPPLQTMSLEVTSVMGWGLLVSVLEMKGEHMGRERGEREKGEIRWERMMGVWEEDLHHHKTEL